MKTADMPSAEALRQHPLLAPLTEAQLSFLQQKGRVLEYEDGEALFKQGDEINDMCLVLEGALQYSMEVGGALTPSGRQEKGGVAGVLPYSRLRRAQGGGTAVGATRLLCLHRDFFPELEDLVPELVQQLVSLMTDRVREATKTQQQFEKLAALGKLSAGLAHELNNPAAAIQRAAAELQKTVAALPELTLQLLEEKLTTADVLRLKEMLTKADRQAVNSLPVLERSEREDELADWLEAQGVPESWLKARTFLDAGLTVHALQTLAEQEPEPAALCAALNWLDNHLNAASQVDDIHEAAKRISDLVASIKVYAHMDRALEMEQVQLEAGLESTLVMLNHKIKKKNIQVKRRYEEGLPPVKGFAGELNQLWTNLIDNAVDAMDEKGELTIQTSHSGGHVQVSIIDNGAGIADDILSRIFDPFFTTKAVGQGTGLGLDIANNIAKVHNASIKVSSAPGRTEFEVCFPLDKP